MSKFIQLLAIQHQYIVQDVTDALSAVEQLSTNMFGYERSDISTEVEHKQFTAFNINFYVQKLNTTDYLVFITTKLNMQA